jgi:hypothetical protein
MMMRPKKDKPSKPKADLGKSANSDEAIKADLENYAQEMRELLDRRRDSRYRAA